jgi:RNA polymerase primary sigma factor
MRNAKSGRPPAQKRENHLSNYETIPSFVSGNGSAKRHTSSGSITTTIRDLVRLAHEQGSLTYDDIKEAAEPEDQDQVLAHLRNLEIEVVHRSDLESPSGPEREDDPEHARAGCLDNSLRAYLRQITEFRLLTRAQEVDIYRQIEAAEGGIREILYRMGFAAREHIALAEKLVAVPPKERFDRAIVQKFAERPERCHKDLVRLIRKVRELDERADAARAQSS